MSIFPHQMYEPGPTCVLCGSKLIINDRPVAFHTLNIYGFVKCCDGCYDGNAGGWNAETGKILMKIISERNLPIPPSNPNGLMPRD